MLQLFLARVVRSLSLPCEDYGDWGHVLPVVGHEPGQEMQGVLRLVVRVVFGEGLGRVFGRHGLGVWALGDHRAEGVHHGAEPTDLGDLLPADFARVAALVQALVVLQDAGLDFIETQSQLVRYLQSQKRVHVDLGSLVRRERGRLGQDELRDFAHAHVV